MRPLDTNERLRGKTMSTSQHTLLCAIIGVILLFGYLVVGGIEYRGIIARIDKAEQAALDRGAVIFGAEICTAPNGVRYVRRVSTGEVVR
jgi:hypothetical protein